MERGLAACVAGLQSPNGDFSHFMDNRSGARLERRSLFYSGEAAYALALLHAETGEQRWLDASSAALDHITEQTTAYFGSRYYLFPDSWTAMAIEELLPYVTRPAWTRYSMDLAQSYADYVLGPGDTDRPELWGSFSFSPWLPPQSTVASTNLEGMLSTLALLRHTGGRSERLERATSGGLSFLLSQQYRHEDGWLLAAPERGVGGVRESPAEPRVRIDYTQHAAAAFVRGAAWLRTSAASAGPAGSGEGKRQLEHGP